MKAKNHHAYANYQGKKSFSVVVNMAKLAEASFSKSLE